MRKIRKRTKRSTPAVRRRLLLVASLFVVAAVMLLRSRNDLDDIARTSRPETTKPSLPTTASPRANLVAASPPEAATNPRVIRAQEAVARHMTAFVSDRHALVDRIAQRLGTEPPAEIDAFFAAVAAGRWGEVDTLFHSLAERFTGQNDPEAAQPIFAPVYETYCVADLVQTWPADRLLEAGRAVLESSGSATVYVCRTDTSLWLATLVNDARGPDRKILIGQSLLSDAAYADYLRFLYPEKMVPLSSQDMSRARQACVMGSAHEPQSPGESNANGLSERLNRELMRTLVNMNPQLTFAWEERN